MAANDTDVEKAVDSGDIEMQEKGNEEEVRFIQPNHHEKEPEKVKTTKVEFSGLTKEELMKFSNDPFWKRVRLILFILFWLVWVGMLVGAILVIVFTPKCPKRPNLEFWQKKTAYWMDPFAFKDSNGDGFGDINGIIEKLGYLKKDLGVGFLILDPIFHGHFTNPTNYLGMTRNFKQIDEKLGNDKDFKALIKATRKKGMEIVLVFNPNQISYDALKELGDGLSENEKANLFMEQSANTTAAVGWLSRTGKGAWVTCNSTTLYTSLGYGENPATEECLAPDLNLKNPVVLKEIKSALKYWMDIGVQGFVFTDAAFYAENLGDSSKEVTDFGNNDPYFKTKNKGQMYQPETVEFLQEIRATLDEMKQKTDKPRLLLVESGNVGYGLQLNGDPALDFFGSTENPAAHMVISYEFVRNRAWKITLPVTKVDLGKSRINNFINDFNGTADSPRKDIALTTATSTNLRQNSISDVAATFLLPGTPIIYYGSELGLNYDADALTRNKDAAGSVGELPFYPNGKRSVLYKPGSENILEMDLYNHLMMPWQPALLSNETYLAYANQFGTSENVMAVTAVGRGDTIFQLYKQLAKIREKPSLLWGSFKWIADPIYDQGSLGLVRQEIFQRHATGFPKYAVVIMEHKGKGKTVSLSKACAKAKPRVVYPPNSNLPLGKEISTDTVYIKTGSTGAVHVFECVE